MDNEKLIRIEQFCNFYEIEYSFIEALQEHGLVTCHEIEQHKYLSFEQLREIEKMIRLHYELNINIEGIDVICNLLNRIEQLNQELQVARNNSITKKQNNS